MTTKKNLILFFFISSFLVGLLPCFNYFYFKRTIKTEKEMTLEQFFTLDGLYAFKNEWLLKYQLSGNFNHVIVGQMGEVYLGNHYGNILRRYNETYTIKKAEYQSLAERLSLLQNYLQEKNIAFLISIVPEKHKIFTEDLPRWFHFRGDNILEYIIYLFDRASINYIYIKGVLEAESAISYYRGDTHWNTLGGTLGYQQALQHLSSAIKIIPDLQLSPIQIEITGDLYRLLKINRVFIENDYRWNTYLPSKKIIKCDFDYVKFKEGKCNESMNKATIVNQQAYVTYNEAALNKKRVLWVRDSFGDINSPLMQDTFSEIVQIHYYFVGGERIYELIEKVKPDYVFYQVIERNIDRIN